VVPQLPQSSPSHVKVSVPQPVTAGQASSNGSLRNLVKELVREVIREEGTSPTRSQAMAQTAGHQTFAVS